MSEQQELDRLADDGCPLTEQEYSEEMHRQNDPHYISDSDLCGVEVWEDDDGCEMLMECPKCDGDGETSTAVEGNGRISFDCPECGGTGWV